MLSNISMLKFSIDFLIQVKAYTNPNVEMQHKLTCTVNFQK